MLCYRIGGTRHGTGNHPSRETILLVVPGIRSILNADLHAFHFDQLNLWWSKIHLDWSWFCNITDVLQRPVLSFCWSEYLSRDENTDFTPLCHSNIMDAFPPVFLGLNLVTLRCALPVQSPSIRVFRFHHRL